ncbi:MAG TPA: hypothetical protein VJP79_01665 [Nitrososphaera sp.]|nr:hypothetical protein [Nitrososphaera sp.]
MSGANQNLVEKLDKIYHCVQCRAVFLFGSDAADHAEALGHREIQTYPFA